MIPYYITYVNKVFAKSLTDFLNSSIVYTSKAHNIEWDNKCYIEEEEIMFNLLLSALCWNAFKATPESPAKRRRYNLSTNFSRR